MTSKNEGPDKSAELTENEAELWASLVVFSQLLTPSMDSRLREVGLTLFEYGALMSLSDAPGNTLKISEMAERTYAPVPRMSKVVGRLQDRGLVARAPSASDGRAKLIALTEEGREVLDAASTVQATAAHDLVLDRISGEDARTLAGILGPLVHSLDPAGPVGG